jgi:CHAT domain-containing protein
MHQLRYLLLILLTGSGFSSDGKKISLSGISNPKHMEYIFRNIRDKKEAYKKNGTPGDIKEDIAFIKQAIRECESMRQTLYSSKGELYYTEKTASLNETGLFLLTHYYQNNTDRYFLDNILFFAENNKANQLRNRVTAAASEGLLPKHEQVRSAAIISRLNYFTSLNDKEKTSGNMEDSIKYYRALHEKFMKTIKTNYPRIYALKYGEDPVTIKKIRKELKKQHAFMEYFNDGVNCYCLVISKKKITYKICGSKQKIDALIKNYNTSIIGKRFDKNLNEEISRILLTNIDEKHLVVSPDGLIYTISFDALREDKQYLLYDHSLVYTFSATSYFMPEPPGESKSIIGFCPDFSNTNYTVLNSSREREALRAFFHYEGIYSSTAFKEQFKSKCGNAGIIHIASHILVDSLSPLKSSLVFEPGKKNYLLSVDEIWKMHINTQLITLAACESNFLSPANSDGLINFTWAFQYCGAHNILSTQWGAADKSTSIILSDFYKNLKAGESKQEALRLAKIHFLHNADAIGAQPYFWANYSLYGDETELKIRREFLARAWWAPVLILSLCYIALLSYKRYIAKPTYEIV